MDESKRLGSSGGLHTVIAKTDWGDDAEIWLDVVGVVVGWVW